ncbi:flagellar hook-basal body protein [Paenibacillus thalictri]|uniref:Flagellar hook-basal body protein n=1 Tax=Paenibacillus thalictri TaxID=2527873 RepID=A0A4Q9DLM2_9BACL|nr:flagellar hook-basal body protein [Paenibacillus thalictri]TBL72973.1 flagellar hook-basal body protein [Paenibacillus thalictri]
MNHSMINASVSMHALQQKLDLVSNNIANSNTIGYKRREASFQDVLTSVKQQPEGFQKEGRLTPLGYNHGWGAKLVRSETNMAQGSAVASDNPLDLAIEGNGLFELTVNSLDANGQQVQQTAWTRSGAFQLSPDPTGTGNMYLTTKDGHYVMGTDNNPVSVPANHRLVIEDNGQIMAYSNEDNTAPPIAAGQIKLVRVIRPQLLLQMGENMYGLPQDTAVNREQILQTFNGATPNDTDSIKVKQHFLEQSNVSLADEISEMLVVQRAFQLNSRAITSADTMMNIANNLRG